MKRLGITTCLAAIPSLTLTIMAATGVAETGPAIIGILLTILSTAAFARIWGHDLDLLSDALRRAGSGDARPTPEAADAVLMETLGQEIDHLARRLADRTDLLDQHRRADTLILERLPDPVIVLARDNAIVRANPAATAAFGDDLAAVLRHPALRTAIGRALTSRTATTAEISLRAPMPRDLLATVVPMDPPLADGGQTLVVISDRTRERVVERMRADFVANVSHELRTPLASLIGFVETLRGPAADDPPAQQRFLEIMAEQGARMNRLIDDLLSLSRIELTEHQTPSGRLDLVRLVTRMVAGFEPRLTERRLQLALKIDQDVPVVAGDYDQMAQVLQNLLDNAVKYGRDGGVLSVDLGHAPQGDRWPVRRGLVISVKDQGAGIPREHLPRLTERFYRVDKGRSRAVGGTGLGLAIVKHIVNRHRGQLLIESEVGQGTTISVWLPVPLVAPRAPDGD